MAAAAYSFRMFDKEPQHFDFYDDLFEQYVDADQLNFADEFSSARTSSSDFGNYFDFPDTLSGTNPNDSPLQGSLKLGSCPKASLSETDLLSVFDIFTPTEHACGPLTTPNPSCPSSPIFGFLAANVQAEVRRSASCGVHKRQSSSFEMNHPRASRHGSKQRMHKLEASASTYGAANPDFDAQISPLQDAGFTRLPHNTAQDGWNQQYAAYSDMSSRSSMYFNGQPSSPLASPTMDVHASHRSSMIHSPTSPFGFDAYGAQDGSYALASPFQERTLSRTFDQSDLYSDSSAAQYWWPQQHAVPCFEQRYSMQAMGGTCPEDVMLPTFIDQMLLDGSGLPVGYGMMPAAVPMQEASYTTSPPLYPPSYAVKQEPLPSPLYPSSYTVKQEQQIPDYKRENSHSRKHTDRKSRSPSPHSSTPRSSHHSSSHKPSRSHRRCKSSVSGSRAASSSASGSNGGVSFVHMTQEHSKQILAGVAPSGSSKTKARRDRENAEMLRRAVLESGGDLKALDRSRG